MIDMKIDLKEAEELKQIYNHYRDKTKEFMKITQFNVQNFFGNVISEANFCQEQTKKLKNFSAKVM